ncbi:MAG: HD domain-containing protein [Proteobacteria bacterium]|nr:HD domain-containing protein [Pseudomonadota bacterium]MDA0929670.1 HD domain-containing protein [Pseudomonadota bacterium]
MDALKQYLIDNFEGVFILIILTFVSAIVWFVDAKLSFLNFFYLPVLLSSYYLGIRSGVLGAFFTFLVIVIFAGIYPERFMVEIDLFGLWAFILTWAGFLILTAVIVGFTHRELQEKMTEALRAKAEASGNAELLEQTMTTIREFESELDFKVEERTRALEEKTKSIRAHKEKVEEALYSTMDPAVVKLMIENRIRTENRRISVMFSDLKGFTQYSEEHSAEVVITELNKYLGDMENILLTYNAHIDKYMGDGIMSEFGAPIRYERHALLAVAAAWKMQERMRKANYPFKLRIGISTGVATTGIIGAKRQSFTAFGDTVNLASRIEGMCEPGAVTVDEATYKECNEIFEFRPVSGLASYTQFENATVVDEINSLMTEIEANPRDVNLRISVAKLLRQANDPEQAHLQLKTAMSVEPENSDVKVAYAENSVILEQQRDLTVRGRRSTVHLYEVVKFKNPLERNVQLPKQLLEGIEPKLSKLVSYPEDLVLPVECIDGSVGFSRLVGITAYLIADRMGMVDQEKHDILEAGYLGQIGKTIVPENILNRNGGLTEDDFTHIHMHPREGVRKLRNIGYENERMLELIECSHENYDGSGYPAGIKGDNIPLGARILAVSEAYVSLTSKRPYRDPWEGNAAFNEIGKYVRSGKFDPAVVDVLGDIVGQL